MKGRIGARGVASKTLGHKATKLKQRSSKDNARHSQILVSPRVFTAVKDAVTIEPVGEFTLKGIARPMAVCNVLDAKPAN
jgi:hypothetical protein